MDQNIQQDINEAVRNTATLVDLTISMWAGQRTDRKISDKVRLDADAVGDTGRYVKNLLAGCDTKLKTARAAYAAARAEHYSSTLPWNGVGMSGERTAGPRLLPNALFMDYLKRMGALRTQAEAARDEFIAEYPALVEQALKNLNGLANPDDYPSADEVKNSFRLGFDFQPIPSGSQFRGLDQNAVSALGKALELRQRSAIEMAQKVMWERARENIEHMIDRLEDVEGRFKSSTVENVRQLITLMPSLNVMNDERVTKFVSALDDMLRGVEAKDLRDDAQLRGSTLATARGILSRMNEEIVE